MPDDTHQRPWPSHVTNLISNTRDVIRLVNLHGALAGRKRGRPRNFEVLHKGAIVLLIACWEAFIEDLATNGFEALLEGAESASDLPVKVRTLASKSLREDPDERTVWKLAGDGWRTVLVDHRALVFERYIGRLNTPRPAQVDGLFENLVGLKALSSNWKWKHMANKPALARLEQLISMRGEISHRVSASRSVRKSDVVNGVTLINRLAAISSNQVRRFLMEHMEKEPWIRVSFGRTG